MRSERPLKKTGKTRDISKKTNISISGFLLNYMSGFRNI
jgi:hypothetical protein